MIYIEEDIFMGFEEITAKLGKVSLNICGALYIQHKIHHWKGPIFGKNTTISLKQQR